MKTLELEGITDDAALSVTLADDRVELRFQRTTDGEVVYTALDPPRQRQLAVFLQRALVDGDSFKETLTSFPYEVRCEMLGDGVASLMVVYPAPDGDAMWGIDMLMRQPEVRKLLTFLQRIGAPSTAGPGSFGKSTPVFGL